MQTDDQDSGANRATHGDGDCELICCRLGTAIYILPLASSISIDVPVALQAQPDLVSSLQAVLV